MRYNGWTNWETWHANMTLVNYTEALARETIERARRDDIHAFEAWARATYLDALRALEVDDPETYAEIGAVDWAEVYDDARTE